MKIAIGCDHAGYELKAAIITHFKALGHDITNYGTDGPDSVDYPDFAHPVCEDVETEKADLGVLICGSANGMAMSANKHQNVRCALSWLPEIAALGRQHNNANVVAIPARFVTKTLGIDIAETFINEKFEGGRHERRVNKIACS
jgi:ribose 5-phosphate isomerase B